MAVIDHDIAVIDHGMAVIDHGIAAIDHGIAVIDHGIAVIDHGIAVIDHGIAVINQSLLLIVARRQNVFLFKMYATHESQDMVIQILFFYNSLPLCTFLDMQTKTEAFQINFHIPYNKNPNGFQCF